MKLEHKVEDRLTTLFSITQSIQTRLIQAALRGGMSVSVSDEINYQADQLKIHAYKLSQLGEDK